MSAIKVPTIFTAVDKFSSPVRRMTKSTQTFAQKAEANIARLDRRMRRLTPSIGAMGKQMLGFAGTAAVGSLLVNSGNNIVEFEKKVASLSAITGVSGKELEKFKGKIFDVAKETEESSINVAKGFELVGSAKPELLKSADGLAAVTKASILMSQASGDEMEVSVQSLVGTMNQFGLAANQASRVVNVLAAGSKEGAAAIPSITEAMDKFGVVAAASNISVEQSVGLIETLAEKNVKGAEAGTKLRNVLTKMATAEALPPKALEQLKKFGVNTKLVMDKSVAFSVRLKELSKIQNDATALAKVFGTENLVAGQIVLQNVDKVGKYTEAVTGTNVAQEQADKNMATFSKRLTSLKNKWVNLITESKTLNNFLKKLAKTFDFVADNLETISKWVLRLTGLWFGMKVMLWGARTAMLAYNIWLGISGALSSTAAIAVGANTTALGAYNFVTKAAAFVTKIWTGAQWLLNVALNANPIGLVVLAILALIAVTTIIIKKYDEWGAAATLLLGPFGMLISIVQEFRRSWDKITEAFEKGGIKSGIIEIGKTFAAALLNPLQQFFELLSKVPGLGSFGDANVKIIQGIKDKIGIETPALNPKKAEQNALTERIENTTNTNATLTVRAPKGTTDLESDNNFFPIIETSLAGGFN